MVNRETSTLTSVAANVRELALTVRELAGTVRDHTRAIGALEVSVVEMRQEMRAGFRTSDEHFAELRDLIIDLRD
jgi:hypothetical protein